MSRDLKRKTGQRERRLNRRVKRVPQKNCRGKIGFRERSGARKNRKEVVRVIGANGVGRTGVFYENRGARKVRRVVGNFKEGF